MEDGGYLCGKEGFPLTLQDFKPLKTYKRSDLVHWEDLEGAGREGGGRGDRDGEHM